MKMKYWTSMRAWNLPLVVIAILLSSFANAQTFTDKFVSWDPRGKLFDIICFSKENQMVMSVKDAEMIQIKKTKFKIKTEKGIEEFENLNCVMEQKGTMTVARMEFTEAMYKVDCELAVQTFRRNDFRLLNKTKTFTTIKRLSDGKVWILPSNSCKVTMVLPSLKTDLPEQAPVPVPREDSHPMESASNEK